MPLNRSAAEPPAQLSLFDDLPPPATRATAPDRHVAPAAPLPPPARTLPDRPLPPPTISVPTVPNAALPPPMTAPLHGPSTFRHPRAHREIRLGEHRVAYELRRARRRSIGFVVGPEGLTVSAPRWVGHGEVENALREKERWIVRKLQEQGERAARMQASRIEWCDGTAVPFLGEQVIVVLDPRAQGAVLNTAADALPGVPRLTLHVGLPQNAAPEQIRELVQSWLQRQARRIFEERCQVFAERLGVRIKRLSLSSATTRWGSASADGSIRLHWRLVHFGLPIIDYVVTHELAHLREMNHSVAFWGVVRSVLPDYEDALGALRKQVLPAFD